MAVNLRGLNSKAKALHSNSLYMQWYNLNTLMPTAVEPAWLDTNLHYFSSEFKEAVEQYRSCDLMKLFGYRRFLYDMAEMQELTGFEQGGAVLKCLNDNSKGKNKNGVLKNVIVPRPQFCLGGYLPATALDDTIELEVREGSHPTFYPRDYYTTRYDKEEKRIRVFITSASDMPDAIHPLFTKADNRVSDNHYKDMLAITNWSANKYTVQIASVPIVNSKCVMGEPVLDVKKEEVYRNNNKIFSSSRRVFKVDLSLYKSKVLSLDEQFYVSVYYKPLEEHKIWTLAELNCERELDRLPTIDEPELIEELLKGKNLQNLLGDLGSEEMGSWY